VLFDLPSVFFYSNDSHTVRSSLGVSEKVILSISFIVKSDVDPFSLGELSGSFKNILGLASMLSKVKYQLKSKLDTTEDGRNIYSLSMISNDEMIASAGTKILDHNAPDKLEVNLDFSQAPTDSDLFGKEFIKGRLGIEFILQRQIVNVLEMIALANGNDLDEKDHWTLTMLKAFRNMELELTFDDLTAFWKHFLIVVGMGEEGKTGEGGGEEKKLPFEVLSWGSLREGLEPALAKVMGMEDLPAPAKELYRKVQEYLVGLHAIRFCLDKHMFALECKDLNLFALFPSLDDLLKEKEKK